jgi:ribosomal protein S18 acetylase RimI-like enzyme
MIRPAQPGEAETIRALVREAYAHYVERIGGEPGPMKDDYHRRVADNQAWVLEDGGQIAGLAVLVEDRPEALLLDNVAVAPAAQGKGYGRQLIAFAEEEARRRGYGELHLYTHMLMTENIALYQRLGFREIGRIQEKGYHRVYMAKSVV